MAYPLADVFLRTEDMIFMRDQMVLFIYTMAAFLPVFSLVYVGSSLMQSLEKAGQAMINTLIRNIAITIGYALVALVIGGGLFEIGLALIVVEVLGGIAMVIHGKIVLEKTAARLSSDSPA